MTIFTGVKSCQMAEIFNNPPGETLERRCPAWTSRRTEICPPPWCSGQHVWLATRRSRVRFPAIPRHFFLDPSSINKPDTCFYIDAYSFTNRSSGVQSENLIEFMQDTPLSTKLRTLFTKEFPTSQMEKKMKTIQGNLGPMWDQIGSKLNSTQQQAISRYLDRNEKDFLLIHGMPGTGKTHTLATLIRVLVSLGQRVLVTSLSNKAVDNVLLLLVNSEVNVLRLGSGEDIGIHPDLKNFTLNSLLVKHQKNLHSPEQLRTILNQINVFGVTSKGSASSHHDFLRQLEIDCVVFDEAGQLPFYDALPALLARTNLTNAGGYIVVGDPKQLAPQSNDQSLFEKISTIDCERISLREQYRMNQTITDLANCLTYEGELSCANSTVANAGISLPETHSEVLTKAVNQAAWLRQPLSTHLNDAVLFLDTQQLKLNDRCSNRHEVALIMHLIRHWLQAGLSAKDIAVIATYTAQVSLFRKVNQQYSDIEISTVDAFQGRDKSLIFYSCTRTEGMHCGGEKSILNDPRRLNVALTRAKNKIVFVGTIETLKTFQPYEKMFRYLKETQIVRLEEGKSNFNWGPILNELN